MKILLVLLTIGLLSCKTDLDTFEKVELNIVELDPQLLRSKSIIIIPREGCGGCIQNATLYVKININSIESKVIFTGVKDKKLLRIQLGDSLLHRKDKIFFDSRNILMTTEHTSIYPVLITLNESKISSIEVYSPHL